MPRRPVIRSRSGLLNVTTPRAERPDEHYRNLVPQ